MELHQAEAIAQELMAELGPFCQKIEVAGSIRRRRSWVNDIDLVLIPRNQGLLATKLHELGGLGGPKVQRARYKGLPVDIYVAAPETWATLLLIRTGSARHNLELATRCKARGWRLKANGDGILDHQGNRIAGDTEESIFKALGLPYKEPWERE